LHVQVIRPQSLSPLASQQSNQRPFHPEHVPAIQNIPELSLKAVYSRSQQSAQALAESSGSNVEFYYDAPATQGKSLDDLLARSDVHAVIVVLPILSQPEVIRKALTAGKHVLSEKPIAKDVKTARDLVDFYNGLATKPLWGVAENFRYMEPFVYARNALKEIGGDVRTFSLKLHTITAEDNKYYHTEW
jgi:predicted dehydrogenase